MILNNEKNIQLFLFELRKCVPFYGFSQSAIKIIFLKYLLNYKNITEQETLKLILEYQKMFIEKRFNQQVVNALIKKIESNMKIDNESIENSIDKFLNEHKQNKDKLFEIMNIIELPQETEEMIQLLELILDYNDGKDVSRTINYYTNKSLIELVERILKVSNKDIYMDTFCGFYRSGLKLNAKMYKGYEINEEALAIAQMVMILTNKQNFNLTNKDFYNCYEEEAANKVFTDGPLNAKIEALDSKKSDYCNIIYTIKSMKNGGLGVVTTISNILYRTDYKTLREEVTKNNLKAIIALPPLFSGTNINTILLVLEKSKSNQNIIFIDATDEKYFETDKRISLLKEEAINKNMDALEGKSIDNFSAVVDINKVLSTKDISWQPNIYIKKVIQNTTRTLNEINNDLQKLYDKLSKLINVK